MIPLKDKMFCGNGSAYAGAFSIKDVKESINNTLRMIKETIEANNGVNVENFEWIVKDFKENFGDELCAKGEQDGQ